MQNFIEHSGVWHPVDDVYRAISVSVNQYRSALCAEVTHQLLIRVERLEGLCLWLCQWRNTAPQVVGQLSPVILISIQGIGLTSRLKDGRSLTAAVGGKNPDQYIANLKTLLVERPERQPQIMAEGAVGVGDNVDEMFRMLRPLRHPRRRLQPVPDSHSCLLARRRGSHAAGVRHNPQRHEYHPE